MHKDDLERAVNEVAARLSAFLDKPFESECSISQAAKIAQVVHGYAQIERMDRLFR